jgi:hypothetical protein
MLTEAIAIKATIVLRNMTHPSWIFVLGSMTLPRPSLHVRKQNLGRALTSRVVGGLTSARLDRHQQPRQILLNLRSTLAISASIASSSLVLPAAEPVVTPPPDDCAVPALLVPGGGGEATFAELPAPLGSLPELFSPPALAGPDGTPLTPAVPAPVEPAFGEPTALPVPAVGPLAAPPAVPALAPPAAPPAPPAPPPCASEMAGNTSMPIAVRAAARDILIIGNLLFSS